MAAAHIRPYRRAPLGLRLGQRTSGWLSNPKHKTVYDPFQKGLSHYLEATNKPERLADVITDMYEAVEALARVITGRDRDLSTNREMFISRIGASEYCKAEIHRIKLISESDPTGIRTRVFAVRGRCPWPLDDGAACREARTDSSR